MTGMNGANDAMVLLWILGLVITVLWIALPFAVFGIKKRLDAILVELKRLNERARQDSAAR